ncbi:MAG: HlyD family type I secretion periplasmic adaptor subunit [Burkholderiaceae bacterium]
MSGFLKKISQCWESSFPALPPIATSVHDWQAQQAIIKRKFNLLRYVGITFLALLVWSMFAQVSEVARGEARIVPSQKLQVVQAVDGGIISQIMVAEGQFVKAGQALLQLDQTRFLSSLRENQSLYDSLISRVARLRALAEGKPFSVPDSVVKSSPQIVAQERELYENKIHEMGTLISIARQQLSQRKQERDEANARTRAAGSAFELSQRELEAMRPLTRSGAVSDVEILKLEKEVSRNRGDREMAQTQVSRLNYSIEEANQKIREVELNFRNEARRELSEAQAKLNGISETNVGLTDKVQKTTIKAPVSGIVKRIIFTTQGAVVTPGKELLEIVPNDDVLIFETKLSPRDIAFVHPGQAAVVKISAYDYTVYGGLRGRVESIGADSSVDENGRPYYLVRVQTERKNLAKTMPLIPGMVAEVDVVTAERSLLTYLMKPILRAKSRAFGER